MAPVLTPLMLTLGPVGDLLRLPDKAAALSLPLSVRAQAYRPGGSLRIVKFDRPGDASVNLYILVGPLTLVILDCERTALELQQLVARARGMAVVLCLTAAAGWLAITFVFMEYWEPKLNAAVFAALLVASVLMS